MIDLIIPYYNNPEGLKRTLASIDQNIFYVTIIDDNSDYTPWCPKAHQVFRYNQNNGPGYARQLGLNKTFNPYIMFLDTGDIFTSQEAQEGILNIITLNPHLDFISFPYFHYGELTAEDDNRLHGKVYKRELLEKYDITFAPESSYLDEDIGFNRTCRLCTKMAYVPRAVIEQIKDESSITQKNNNAAMYRDQTRALSLVSIHTINTCIKNNIPIDNELIQITVALYYWFIRTAAERPEFIQDAWNGVKIFYDHYKKEISPNKLLVGNAYLKKCLQYRNKISFPINILRFVHDVQNNLQIPKQYLGGD